MAELKPRKQGGPPRRSTITIPTVVADRLRKFAEEKKVTMSSCMEVALEKWLGKQGV